MSDFLTKPTVSDNGARIKGAPFHLVDNSMLPRSHKVCALNTPDLTEGTIGGWGLTNNTWYMHGVSWTTSNGAKMHFDFYLAGGNWKVQWYSDKRSDYGIQRFLLDGVSFGATVDHYAAARVRAIQVETFSVARGLHRISRHCTGKNASSSNYLMTFSGMILTRTD